jgi:hypothetical protein
VNSETKRYNTTAMTDTLAEGYDSAARGSLTCSPEASSRHTQPMGFDPTRKHVRRPLDAVIVASGLLLTAALVLWALFG